MREIRPVFAFLQRNTISVAQILLQSNSTRFLCSVFADSFSAQHV